MSVCNKRGGGGGGGPAGGCRAELEQCLNRILPACIRSALSVRPHYAFELMHVQLSSVVQST